MAPLVECIRAHGFRSLSFDLIYGLKLDTLECNRQFNIDFNSDFGEEISGLRAMEEDGLLEISKTRIQVTPSGRSFLRIICMPFDAYLGNHSGDRPTPHFSATV